jgi:hypothetical protein
MRLIRWTPGAIRGQQDESYPWNARRASSGAAVGPIRPVGKAATRKYQRREFPLVGSSWETVRIWGCDMRSHVVSEDVEEVD